MRERHEVCLVSHILSPSQCFSKLIEVCNVEIEVTFVVLIVHVAHQPMKTVGGFICLVSG